MVETRISFNYLLARLAASILVLWVLLTLLFFLLKAMPGDATALFLNPNLEPSDIRAVRQRFGLDQPLWMQYLKWVRNYLVLDFGTSFMTNEPVSTVIARRLPRTLALFGTAFLLNITIGIITGIHFGWNRGSRIDRSGFVMGLSLYSIPFFWIAWMLLLVFSYKGFGVEWFPSAHMTTPFQSEFSTGEFIVDVLWHMLLPAASLIIIGWAGMMLVMRTSMQEVVNKPYIETARAKGLAPTTIKYKHGARNALIPVTTQAIVGIAFVIDGSVIVETVFSWPGMGTLLVRAILNRDLPTALATFYMLGVLIVVLRFLTDVVYTFLDPRIKFGESE